jgi:hypothetical protein
MRGVPLRETVKQEREPCPGPPSSCPGSFASPLGTKLIRHTLHPHTHTPTPNDALRRRKCVVHMQMARVLVLATTPVPAQEY